MCYILVAHNTVHVHVLSSYGLWSVRSLIPAARLNVGLFSLGVIPEIDLVEIQISFISCNFFNFLFLKKMLPVSNTCEEGIDRCTSCFQYGKNKKQIWLMAPCVSSKHSCLNCTEQLRLVIIQVFDYTKCLDKDADFEVLKILYVLAVGMH